MFAFIITLVNCGLAIDICLKWMTSPKIFQQKLEKEINRDRLSDIPSKMKNIPIKVQMSGVFTKLGKSARFPKYLLKYRQLQIITIVTNQLCSYIMPIGMCVAVVGCCVVGYFVIKLSGQVPLTLTLLSIFVLILIILAAHTLTPLGAEVTTKCEAFIMFWRLQGFSSYRKRQLKSLKPLCVRVGPFFTIKKQTRGLFLSMVLYYTATLVISV